MPFLKKHLRDLPRSKRIEISTHRQGLRHAIFNSVGDKYKGEWQTDVKCGKGVMWTRKGMLYEGDFERNYRHGFGVLAHKLPCNVYSLEYRGDWKNGLMDGNGLRVYPDGSFYKGQFRRGKRHGYGQMWYADDAFYDGYWVKDKRQGEGMLVGADGNRYEGQWWNDEKHGHGIYFHLDSGQMQEGLWKESFCLFSTLRDIPFRQTSKSPTQFAISDAEIQNADIFCRDMMNFIKKQDSPLSTCGFSNRRESLHSSNSVYIQV